MRRRKIDSGLERQFLIGMITSKPFLASVASMEELDLIESDAFRQVARWCADYFHHYGEPPNGQIETIYHSWAEDREPDDPMVSAIHDFLEHLSAEHETARDLNHRYLLDEMGSYLSLKKLGRLRDNIDDALLRGEATEGLTTVQSFTGVDLGRGVGIDPLNDRAAWARAFADPQEPLIKFEGAAKSFFEQAITRDALIGIQGPEKRGKTWWCIEFVVRALREKRKVAFFQVGDLSEGQVMLRLGVRLSKVPLWKSQCGDITVPVNLRRVTTDPDGYPKWEIGRTEVRACPKPISRRGCIRGIRQFLRGNGIPKDKPYLMVSVHANSSINVKGVEGVLERWEQEQEFIPDVIVIDYADILLPEDAKKQSRDQVNDTWKALRRLSQERHCLVIVPTQADTASYDAETQSMKNFSEDKRKLGHVTGMMGLNQTEEEKKAGIMRLNWIVLRESDFSPYRCLWVGQCLSLGRAYCCGAM